nr:VOC family protein [Lachnospira multipara]
MKLKNVLIVVKDIEKSKQFYHDLFGIVVYLKHVKARIGGVNHVRNIKSEVSG